MQLQYAAEWDLSIQQIDVKTALLNGEMLEEVYVKPSPDVGAGKNTVWKLNMALDGLKYAPSVWYDKWTKVLFLIGLKPSDADPCLYVLQI
jgi:hypothetical protein